MSRYVQTFSQRDQAVLNHAFFSFSGPSFITVERQSLKSLWSNLGCRYRSFPGPAQDLPRIRRMDVLAFREIWLQHRLPTVNLPDPLCGHFGPVQWNKSGEVYTALVLAYRTFGLFSTFDIFHVLTNCLDIFHDDELPKCCGEWERDAEKVRWHLEPISKPDLERVISINRSIIQQGIQKQLAMQCDILIALRRLYKPEVSSHDPREVLHANVASNRALGLREVIARMGISLETFLSLPGNGVLAGEYAQFSVPQLEAMFVASRGRSDALRISTDVLAIGDVCGYLLC